MQATSPLGWALKEHNAKCVQIANKFKEDLVVENLRFNKKVIQQYDNGWAQSIGPAVSGMHGTEADAQKKARLAADTLVGRKLDLGSPSFKEGGSKIKSNAGQATSSSSLANKKSRMDDAPGMHHSLLLATNVSGPPKVLNNFSWS